MLMASSVRPAPIRPAMPTTSPASTVKLTSSQTLRSEWCGLRAVQFSTSKIISPIFGARGG